MESQGNRIDGGIAALVNKSLLQKEKNMRNG
jgi:hypothetical protein